MTSIKTKCNSKDILDRAKLVLKIEFEEIQAVSDKLDDGFVGAIELILSSNGRVIVTGMGKSGHIGKNISYIGFNRDIIDVFAPCGSSSW